MSAPHSRNRTDKPHGKRLQEVLGVAILVMLLTACTPKETPLVPTSTSSSQGNDRQTAVLDELDQAIQGEFVYADYGGTDWPALADQFRSQIQQGMTDEAFYQGLHELVSALPEGMASFASRDERISADLEQTNLYEGIGAFVSYRGEPEPHIVILSVIAGSPAESAGLLAHDSVFAIDGVPISETEGIDAVDRIRGPRNTPVELDVASPGGERREVQVLRQQVVASDTVRGGLLNQEIYYMLFPVNGDASILDAIDSVLQTLSEDQNSAGIILDLRISHTSPDWPLGELLVLFNDGELGSFFNRSGSSPLQVTGQDIYGSQTIPLAVLIGPETSGAPEILAAGLAANGRAAIIGQPSLGSTLGFTRSILSDGSELLYASSSFEQQNGTDLSGTGFTPNLIVDVHWDEVTLTNDPVIQAAINTLTSQE